MSFSLDSYFRVLGHKRTLLFLLLCMVAFVASDPSGARPYVPLWFAISFWPILFVFYISMSAICITFFAILAQRYSTLRVPMPLIGFIALIPTITLCKAAVAIASKGTFPYNFVGQLIFYFFTIQGIETVFYRFVFPDISQDIGDSTPQRHLVIGGEKIALAKLLHIEAREHHVHLTFQDEKSSARARLGDIIAQTKAEDGLQPHRSWWVARDPAIRAERKNGRLILRLRDDTEVPVARTRVDDVLNWLNNHVHPAE